MYIACRYLLPYVNSAWYIPRVFAVTSSTSAPPSADPSHDSFSVDARWVMELNMPSRLLGPQPQMLGLARLPAGPTFKWSNIIPTCALSILRSMLSL